MAEVNLVIDGRTYGVACDDGQERRVQQLGQYIDQRMREVSGGSGASNKAQLMVLTSLLLADEVFDLRDGLSRATSAEMTQQPLPPEVQPIYYQGLTPEDENHVTTAISRLASRVEKLAARVKKVA